MDLDGAKAGYPVQLPLIRQISAAVDVPVQVGGGIRTIGSLLAVRDAGAARAVIGTAAVDDRELRLQAIEEAGATLVVAVDAREGIVATHGWQESSGVSVLDLAQELVDDGVSTVLYTDVSRDGMDTGAALEDTAAIARTLPTIASGGVRDMADIVALSKIEGVVGAVVGTALYEGRVTLEELITAANG